MITNLPEPGALLNMLLKQSIRETKKGKERKRKKRKGKAGKGTDRKRKDNRRLQETTGRLRETTGDHKGDYGRLRETTGETTAETTGDYGGDYRRLDGRLRPLDAPRDRAPAIRSPPLSIMKNPYKQAV